MEEFESVHSHFYSSAQSKLNIKNVSDILGETIHSNIRYEKNLVYALSNFSQKDLKKEKKEKKGDWNDTRKFKTRTSQRLSSFTFEMLPMLFRYHLDFILNGRHIALQKRCNKIFLS